VDAAEDRDLVIQQAHTPRVLDTHHAQGCVSSTRGEVSNTFDVCLALAGVCLTLSECAGGRGRGP